MASLQLNSVANPNDLATYRPQIDNKIMSCRREDAGHSLMMSMRSTYTHLQLVS